jgi:hypothetical protein
VTIHFRGEKLPPLTGTVMRFKLPKGEEGARAQPSRLLVVETPRGRSYVEAAEIAAVDSEAGDGKVKRRKAQLVLTVGATDKPETKVVVRYLARGITWAPSYKIDISDPATLKLEQHAVVKNELADLADAEVRLISGYPSVQFGHVRSLFSARTNMAMFFSELGNRGDVLGNLTHNSVVSQQRAVRDNERSPSWGSLDAVPTGEGVDLHYESIGKRTLADGDALSLTVAQGTAKYERIVEWLVPDTRTPTGGPRRGAPRPRRTSLGTRCASRTPSSSP